MKPSSWNDYLSIENPWTRRLLNLEAFTKVRTLEQIETEYNQDKYGNLANFNFSNLEQYKCKEFELAGLTSSNNVVVSFSEELFETSLSSARQIYYSIIYNTVRKYQPENLCELGCGYGYNFSYLQPIAQNLRGGEYSKNAVHIGRRLGLDIQEFNYYEPKHYKLLEKNTTVLTVHSLEQLPSALPFLENLRAHQDSISAVIHFEPCLLLERRSLIGTLRNRYIELNDYNRDLVQLLEHQPDIEILEYQPDIYGLNPLNSTNLVVWKFK